MNLNDIEQMYQESLDGQREYLKKSDQHPLDFAVNPKDVLKRPLDTVNNVISSLTDNIKNIEYLGAKYGASKSDIDNIVNQLNANISLLEEFKKTKNKGILDKTSISNISVPVERFFNKLAKNNQADNKEINVLRDRMVNKLDVDGMTVRDIPKKLKVLDLFTDAKCQAIINNKSLKEKRRNKFKEAYDMVKLDDAQLKSFKKYLYISRLVNVVTSKLSSFRNMVANYPDDERSMQFKKIMNNLPDINLLSEVFIDKGTPNQFLLVKFFNESLLAALNYKGLSIDDKGDVVKIPKNVMKSRNAEDNEKILADIKNSQEKFNDQLDASLGTFNKLFLTVLPFDFVPFLDAKSFNAAIQKDPNLAKLVEDAKNKGFVLNNEKIDLLLSMIDPSKKNQFDAYLSKFSDDNVDQLAEKLLNSCNDLDTIFTLGTIEMRQQRTVSIEPDVRDRNIARRGNVFGPLDLGDDEEKIQLEQPAAKMSFTNAKEAPKKSEPATPKEENKPKKMNIDENSKKMGDAFIKGMNKLPKR